MDDESQIQIYMTDLLEEMKKLNETFNADIEGRGLQIQFCGEKYFLDLFYRNNLILHRLGSTGKAE